MRVTRTCIVVIVASAAVAVASGVAQAKTPTTSPPPIDSEGPSPEIAAIARDRGISSVEAQMLVDSQASIATAIERVRDDPEFLDFRFTPDGLKGQVVVARGSEAKFAAKLDSASVKVTSSALTPTELGAMLSKAEAITGVEAVAFDPYTDTLGLYSSQPDDLRVDVALAIPDGVAVKVFEIVPDQVRFRGGQKAIKGSGYCTTSFGVSVSGTGRYLTAGHCGTGSYTINGNASTSTGGVSISTYNDRMWIAAPGASWFVKIGATGAEVDMQAVAGHIFLNGVYCHYGQAKNALTCGTITAVNVAVPGPPTTLATQSTGTCKPGDSGGPVWRPATSTEDRLPVGLIISGDQSVAPDSTGSYPCRYVALDDQLAGTGWSLL